MSAPETNPQETAPAEFTISLDLGNKIIGYLGTRPYQEVSGIIGELQSTFAEQMIPAPTPTEDK